MTTVFIEARPKGRREGTAIVDYVVEEQGDRALRKRGDALGSSGGVKYPFLNDAPDPMQHAKTGPDTCLCGGRFELGRHLGQKLISLPLLERLGQR
jgi:hypothetical protein